MYKNYINDLFNNFLKSVIQDIEQNSKTEVEIEEKINKIIENMEDVCKESIEIIINDMFEDVTNKMDENYKLIEQDEREFIEHVKSIWDKGFKLSTCLYDIVLEILNRNCEILNSEHVDDIEGNKYKLKVLQLLSNRSLQTFKSVLILIKNGMGDDAFKLCRNLHENWVISTFILQNNEETAKGFLIESNSDINEYNDYEWARNSGMFTRNERTTFNKIFEKCNFENEYSVIWKTQYKKECKLLHTTPQGVTKSLCLPPKVENEIALVGQSPYGLNIAAEHSAIYLINTISNYLMVVENQWNLLNLRVLDKILNMIQYEYTKIAQKMETIN